MVLFQNIVIPVLGGIRQKPKGAFGGKGVPAKVKYKCPAYLSEVIKLLIRISGCRLNVISLK